MSQRDYEQLLKELKWLKTNHPEKQTLITFVERFHRFVKDERQKQELEFQTEKK